jgi:hypothetical protein
MKVLGGARDRAFTSPRGGGFGFSRPRGQLPCSDQEGQAATSPAPSPGIATVWHADCCGEIVRPKASVEGSFMDGTQRRGDMP